MESTRTSGVVKCFNDEKGFGFVRCDDGQEAFFHRKQIKKYMRSSSPTANGVRSFDRRLEPGVRVTFVLLMHEKGLRAERVIPE